MNMITFRSKHLVKIFKCYVLFNAACKYRCYCVVQTIEDINETAFSTIVR
jgi:hypothetical protein